MKVIRVGNNSQSRIAQACDRCRSKKIRCDGVRPCCSQCKNVGFECKTSDKLSRRAFPRGYTESLEDRVRALEAENRELKDLLDEKDEKIDMLSKIHSFSPASRKNSSALTPVSTNESSEGSPSTVGETAEVTPLSPGDTNAAIAGLSSTATFLGMTKERLLHRVRSNAVQNRSSSRLSRLAILKSMCKSAGSYHLYNPQRPRDPPLAPAPMYLHEYCPINMSTFSSKNGLLYFQYYIDQHS